MSPPTVDVAYSDAYLDWVLGPAHPTDPIRAQIAVELLQRDLPARGLAMRIVDPAPSDADSLARVHDQGYVHATLRGDNDEWGSWGELRPDLGRTAALMCGGTEMLARRILAGETKIGFNPQGAKHHAHRDHGSGFCVFNDMALAAEMFMEAGWRVAYLDIDAHHGDGVEALLADRATALTASVHNVPLFPGTGLSSDPDRSVHNWPLVGTAGDGEWLPAVEAALDTITGFQPDVLLAAIGADAHETDPLSNLQVTTDGYRAAGRAIGRAVNVSGIPVLLGGAGGYQPHDVTPQLWASVVTEAVSEISIPSAGRQRETQ